MTDAALAVHRAFYDAVETGDVDLMASLWANPMASLLASPTEVTAPLMANPAHRVGGVLWATAAAGQVGPMMAATSAVACKGAGSSGSPMARTLCR